MLGMLAYAAATRTGMVDALTATCLLDQRLPRVRAAIARRRSMDTAFPEPGVLRSDRRTQAPGRAGRGGHYPVETPGIHQLTDAFAEIRDELTTGP